jgi:hypothetical protein
MKLSLQLTLAQLRWNCWLSQAFQQLLCLSILITLIICTCHGKSALLRSKLAEVVMLLICVWHVPFRSWLGLWLKSLVKTRNFCTFRGSFHIQTDKYFSWQQMMIKLYFWNLMFKLKQSREFCCTHFIHSLTLHIMYNVHQKDLKFMFRIFYSFCSIEKYCYLHSSNNCMYVYFKCHFCTT